MSIYSFNHSKKFKTDYQKRRAEARLITGKGLTEQSHKDSLNINIIFGKYLKTGLMDNQDIHKVFGDFANVPDYQESLNRVIAADEAFATLSSEIRNRFRNNPAELIEFVLNQDNHEEAIKLGLLQPQGSSEATTNANPSPSGGEDTNKTTGGKAATT